ncbi:MAG: isocitrate/isopropylmalate dehydrogenase family protein [Blastocatellia bacterium]
MYQVALISGDGIGPEISDATVRVIEASGARINWQETLIGQEARRRLGAELPWDSLERIRALRVALKAPLIAEKASGGVIVEGGGKTRRHPSINNGLRRELDAYANLRPVRGFAGVSGPYRDLDVVIVRELTEDVYGGIERQVDDDTFEACKRISGTASRRIARYACDYARRAGRRKVTAVHKANVLHLTDGLFLRSVREVAADYPDLECDDLMVDATCYHMVKTPERLDVLVMPNQYGDILSDLLAALAGSLGLAPGANIGPEVAMFEAAHGAAPDIAGRNTANPIGLILSGALLLEHLHEDGAAARVRRGVAAALADERCLTPDLGGRATTTELTRHICEQMQDD